MENTAWRYKDDPAELQLIVPAFIGGQCQISSRSGEVYRGVTRTFIFPEDKKRKQVFIELETMWVKLSLFDRLQQRSRGHWSRVAQPPSGFHFFDVEYSVYYLQPDEERLKIKGIEGKTCHLYLPHDHTNLVKSDSEYLPYYKLHRHEFRMAIMASLLGNKQQ